MDEEIVRYLIARAGRRGLLQTQLVKLLYFADLTAVATFGSQLTSFRWIRYDHGPFAREVYGVQDTLRAQGAVSLARGQTMAGNPYSAIRSTTDEVPDLPSDAVLVLERVLDAYGHLATEDLVRQAYATRPMQTAEFGDDLDLSLARVGDDALDDADMAWLFGGRPWED